MDLSDKKMLAEAVARISNFLGLTIDPGLKESYLNGCYPELLSYRKDGASEPGIPVIQKYILGVESYLAQPSLKRYYDIIRVARVVPLVVVLDRALSSLTDKRVVGYEDRVKKLIRETKFDSFESILFELVVAARYAIQPSVSSVTFIPESPKTQRPDLEVRIDGVTYFVECKKQDRKSDAAEEIGKTVERKIQRVLKLLHRKDTSAILELSFHQDPAQISDIKLKDLVFESLRSRVAVIDTEITVRAIETPVAPLRTYSLFPSYGYYADHFGYDPDGEWQILTPALDCIWKSPSWLDQVRWQTATMWKVTNQDILWRIKRLGYKLIFKGLDQLRQAGHDIILHYWFERDRAIGHRQKELLHLGETLKEKNLINFSWMIFNDVSPSISPRGRFDFVENSHILAGTARKTSDPPVTGVFVSEDQTAEGLAEFGVGHSLPPIDEDDESWQKKSLMRDPKQD